ncbi:MAG TPA: AAA family ATPase [Brevundimonas sp.]|jgi:hypothetical protein|uniref:AAA family ATPase n=1 Tax=Brevundimonas sp. TaxID=1871086 RepID=UPI002DEC7FCF|nr:AAA family ATPase [Brevundimonas sp.]
MRDYDAEFEAAAEAVAARQRQTALPAAVLPDNDWMVDAHPSGLTLPCRPFVWREPATIPRREWLYGRHYIRKFVSATFAPGGLGKSSLAVVEALAMTSGKPLLGLRPSGQLRVAYWSGEDPGDENDRRFMAAASHYGLTPADLGIGGDPDALRLYVGSGRSTPIVMAEQTPSGVEIMVPQVEALETMIRSLRLDCIIIDPFVSSHRVTENDNNAIDRVVKEWARIADHYDVAIELIHHTRKANGAETTVEDGRGASALLYGARSARALNGMTKEEAERAGVENAYQFFRADTGKANMAPRSDVATWHRVISFDLGNGDTGPSDQVGVVIPWKWPDPFDGVQAADLLAVQRLIDGGKWRDNAQANEWVGKAVAEALGLDLDDKAERQKVKALLATWIKSGALVRTLAVDEHRKERPVIEVGKWAEIG